MVLPLFTCSSFAPVSYYQPETQTYGADFPAEHGQAASIFMPDGQGVQQQFAYIPDGGKNVYVLNVEVRTYIRVVQWFAVLILVHSPTRRRPLLAPLPRMPMPAITRPVMPSFSLRLTAL